MKSHLMKYHPVICLTYLVLVIALSVSISHPYFAAVSFISALFTAFAANGKQVMKTLFGTACAMAVITLSNPFFNHGGNTVLCVVFRNRITLESLVYGEVLAVMFGSAILWFSSFNTIMTSEKIMYIFGRIMPSFGLVFSMTLRFIPECRSRLGELKNAQKCIYSDDGAKISAKIKKHIIILSTLVSILIEESVQTAESMKARGFGVGRRTSFSAFIFRPIYLLLIILMLAVELFIFFSFITGKVYSAFIPYISYSGVDKNNIFVYIAYTLLNIAPLISIVISELQERAAVLLDRKSKICYDNGGK